jgi:hypothetical protein
MNNEEKRKLWRELKQSYRKERKEYVFTLKLEQSRKLEALAESMGMSVQEFIKELLKSKINGDGYIVPKNVDISRLILEIRKVGSNVNQIVKHINAEKNVTIYDLQRIKERLTQLESIVVDYFTNPQKVSNDN